MVKQRPPFVRRSVSVLDQFRTAEEQVAKRLRELKPLVAEYHELEKVAQRLGLSVSNDAPAAGPRPPASPRGRRRTAKAAAPAAASKRNGSADGGTAKRSVAVTQARRARPPSTGRAGSNRTSRRQQDVLRLVKQRPGITVSEIAKELGVDATGLYRPVHKLEQDGAIIKRGVTLQPTSG
jgi:uncharacterized membrane protein